MLSPKVASLAATRIPVRRPVTEYPRGHVLRIDFAHLARVLQVKAEREDQAA